MALAGIGPTLLNMGLTGAIGTAYVLLVGGDLNGPTIGAIFTIVGFSAFGKHPKNILPIMTGVFIASLAAQWSASDPSLVLAALFGTTLAPIAGRFGWHWGLVAGFLHASVAQTVGQVHGGLVLYNNGFAAGLVAAVLVPVILSLQPADEGDAYWRQRTSLASIREQAARRALPGATVGLQWRSGTCSVTRRIRRQQVGHLEGVQAFVGAFGAVPGRISKFGANVTIRPRN